MDPRGRRRHRTLDLLERTLEAIQDAVEFYCHLVGQRPTCNVVRRGGRRAGIGEIMGMILRLEEVQDVSTEWLPAPDDIRARRIFLSGHFEIFLRALRLDACVEQSIDKLSCGQ